MKNIFNRTFFPAILILIISLTSCSKSKKSPTFIPKNAGVVAVINGKSLSEKSGVNDLTSTHLFNMLKNKLSSDKKNTLDEFEPIIKNTKKSGIDLKNEIYLFAFQKDSTSYFAIHMKLIDKAKFTDFINKIIKKSGKTVAINSLGRYRYLGFDKKAPIIIWDRNQLLVLVDIKQQNDLGTNATIAKQVLTEDKSESIVSSQQFDNFNKNKKDISLWINYKYLMSNMKPMQRMAVLSKFPMNFKDYTISVYCDFQKGQVVSTFETNLSEQMKKAIKENKVFKDKFNTEILNYFPQKSYINFFGAINLLGYYNLIMKKINIKQGNTEQINNIFQAAFGMSLQDALSEFSGEMGFDIHGFKFAQKKQKNSDKTITVPMPLFSFGIEFNSDKFFNALTNKFGAMLEHKDGYYELTKGKSSIYFNVFGKTLIGTNDIDLIKNIVSGDIKSQSLKNSKIATRLNNQPFYASIDLNFDSYPQEFKTLIKEHDEKNVDAIFNVLSIYDKLEYFPVNHYKWNVILKLKDQKSNSLKTIISSLDNNVGSSH